MIKVWSSNRLERLADRLVEQLAAGGEAPARLFARTPIVVPNLQIATYLKYEVAAASGIAAGLSFSVSEKFLETLLLEHVPAPDPSFRLVGRATLRNLFLDVLDDTSAGGSRLPEPVRAYLDAADDEAGRDLRRFQLATRLARLARQYGDTRPELLRAWAEGNTGLGDGPLADTEGWQRELWARLLAPDGPIARARERGEWSWVLPVELFGVLDGAEGYDPPAAVHLFGFSYLWTGLRELLEHLGRASEVHLYVPSPWKWTADSSLEEPSALRAWGQPGRDLAAMVSGMAGARVQVDFVTGASSTALGRLQREILEDSGAGPDPYEPDGTIRVLACPGIRREAEAIAGEVWRLISADDHALRGRPSAERLRFRDFAVLIADARNRAAYQAHLRAALEELYSIPYTMVDLPMAGESRVIEGVLLLLALPLGSFTRPELLPLLTHPAVGARFPGANAERWRDWCQQLEIVHGADRSDHEGTYIDRDQFHWEQGLLRLVVGTFLSGPRCGSDRGFPLEGADLLPQDEPVEAQADAARLLVLVRSLVADARYARGARLTLGQWSEFLSRMIAAYLAADPDADADRHALADCLAAAGNLKQHDVGGPPVGYRVACEIVREAIAGLTTARGHYLADGVAVSPVLAMRALPFRVTFVCGLGEGLFPALDGPDPLDLALARKQFGDVSPRDRDQYLFLETLASTRDRLYLSYVARDAPTGEAMEPSPLVRELLRHLNRGRTPGTGDDWIRIEPLRRYQETEAPDAPVASIAARREAKAKALRKRFEEHCGVVPELTAERIWRLDPSLRTWLKLGRPDASARRRQRGQRLAVSLRQVRQFLECPLQGWARLRLRLAEDDDDSGDREDEPFATNRGTATVLLREVFFEALAGGQLDGGWSALESLYQRRAEALARAGKMPVGLFREAERRRHQECLTSWATSARDQELLRHVPYRVRRFGRARESERVDDLGPPLPFDVPLPGADGAPKPFRVELHGRTGIVSPGLPGSVKGVARVKEQDKDFLEGFLDALVVSLIDNTDMKEYHAYILTTSPGGKPFEQQRRFRGIDQKQAEAYLTGVLADMLGGPHAYLLPCEAVFDYLGEKRKPVAESVGAMVDNKKSTCSSRYGPVPDFTIYDPPGEDLAREMIERRFGLFRDCGGLGE
jgi:exodeoxyribonuclease V gamma subunit